MTEKEYKAGQTRWANSRTRTRSPAGYKSWQAASANYLESKNKSSSPSSPAPIPKKSSSKDYKDKYRHRSYKDTDTYKENKKLIDSKTEPREVNLTSLDRRDTAKSAAGLNRRFLENKMKDLPSPLKFPGNIRKPKLDKIEPYKLEGKNKESFLKGSSFKPTKSKFKKPTSNDKLKVKIKNPQFDKNKKRYTDLGVGIGKKTKKAK